MERKHTISILVENEFGVLARVAGLFSSKGYNIDSLSVSATMDPSLSRMTIVAHGSDQIIEQIIKQLNKLVNVIKVEDLTAEKHITRELCLVKLKPVQKADLQKIADKLNARILESNAETVVLELTCSDEEINVGLDALHAHSPLEVIRTGMIAIQRGHHLLVQ